MPTISQSFNRIFSISKKDTTITIYGSLISNAFRLISTVIVTRILSPDAYGVIGILGSIATAVELLTDVGIFSYVVRHDKNKDKYFLDSIWTIRLIRSIILTLILILISPILSILIDKPITYAIMAYSFTFLLLGISSMSFATAVRRGQIIRLTVLDVLPQILSLPFTILFAILLKSYWALIIGMLVGASINTILSYVIFPESRRRWRFDREEARELWDFGRVIAASSVIQLILMQADKVILARFLSFSTFGLYTIAATLIAVARAFNGKYVQRVLFPVFAQVKNSKPFIQSAAFYSTGRPFRLFYSFCAGGLVTCSPLVVELLYDPRFAYAAAFLQIMALGNLTNMSVVAANQMLITVGQVRHTFRLNLVRLFFFVAGGIIGMVFWGPIGLVAAVAGVEWVAQLYCWYALRRIGLLNVRMEIPYWAVTLAGCAVGWPINMVGSQLIS